MVVNSARVGIDSTEPMFSLVVPVYNVESFLPAFLDSLAKQRGSLADCQLVFVNDGSTDESAALIRAWIARIGQTAEVIDQPNQGLSVARNAGLERARGTWVSFPDPDDILDPGYLSAVREFIATQSVADLLCTRILLLDDETGRVTDTHPLHRKFRGGARVVNLERSPDAIHLSAATGFYRRARLAELGLRFDATIRPNFEDASLTARYLISADSANLGIVRDAVYLYRKRADSSSLVQGSWTTKDKYTTVMERGYLALLRHVAHQRGTIPIWVQNLILYDLLFYFRTDQSTNSATGLAQEAWTDRFHELAEEILRYIDVETIDGFSVMPTSEQLRAALIIGYKRERTVPTSIRLETLDADQRLARIRYFCGAPLPDEELRIDGRLARAAYSKTRDLTYLNRVLLHERILWVPATAEISVTLNGRRMPLELGPQPRTAYAVAPERIWQRFKKTRRAPPAPIPGKPPAVVAPPSLERRVKSSIRRRFPGAVRTVRGLQRSLVRGRPADATNVLGAPSSSPFAHLDPRSDGPLKREARSWQVRRRYAHAWAFMDRDTEAHDNAEHLYRYVRRHHPDVNAWFVLRRESADWDRLAAEGFRLVPFGTPEHLKLLLNTDQMISSQVDEYVIRPIDATRFGKHPWRFTFLQHGVTKDDLSRWLNGKPIDRFITASPGEHASIVSDHSHYVFTDKEVRLTGFPRHDRLLELKGDVDRPSRILIMPTWRRWLMATAVGGNARELRKPLEESLYWRSWFGLLGSSELRSIAEESGLSIDFMPHPNMQMHVGADDVPSWVRVHTYTAADVQELLVGAAVTITDYSSQAFEAAYLECPVVYYQFDHDDFFSGTHVYRKGTWSYEEDGFGPVALTHAEALEAIADAIARGLPSEPYLTRMRDAFPHRDGRCCERTFDSIVGLTMPATYEEAYHFADEPRATAGDGAEAVGGDAPHEPAAGRGGVPARSAGDREVIAAASRDGIKVDGPAGNR